MANVFPPYANPSLLMNQNILPMPSLKWYTSEIIWWCRPKKSALASKSLYWKDRIITLPTRMIWGYYEVEKLGF
jgi:hypothetical protein